MNPAAVSHVLMKMEHRFTSLIELLGGKKKHREIIILKIWTRALNKIK